MTAKPEIAPCPNPECGMPCELKSLPGPTYRVQCTEKYCYVGPSANTKKAAIRKHDGICKGLTEVALLTACNRLLSIDLSDGVLLGQRIRELRGVVALVNAASGKDWDVETAGIRHKLPKLDRV